MSRATIHDRLASDLPINAVVAPAVVDDPYSTIGEKIKVLRSVRNDPLAGMKARGFIEDHEYQAGRLWQYYLECSQIGRVKAIDPSKPAVDGGRTPEPVTAKSMLASDKINCADRALGEEGCVLLREILEDGRTLKAAAERRDMKSQLGHRYIGRRFRECLETLAELWGLRTEKSHG